MKPPKWFLFGPGPSLSVSSSWSVSVYKSLSNKLSSFPVLTRLSLFTSTILGVITLDLAFRLSYSYTFLGIVSISLFDKAERYRKSLSSLTILISFLYSFKPASKFRYSSSLCKHLHIFQLPSVRTQLLGIESNNSIWIELIF